MNNRCYDHTSFPVKKMTYFIPILSIIPGLKINDNAVKNLASFLIFRDEEITALFAKLFKMIVVLILARIVKDALIIFINRDIDFSTVSLVVVERYLSSFWLFKYHLKIISKWAGIHS